MQKCINLKNKYKKRDRLMVVKSKDTYTINKNNVCKRKRGTNINLTYYINLTY